MPNNSPEWIEGDEHDPGATFVALFAFLGATLLWQLSGRQNGAAAKVSRLLAVGLGAGSAAWLLLRCSFYKKDR